MDTTTSIAALHAVASTVGRRNAGSSDDHAAEGAKVASQTGANFQPLRETGAVNDAAAAAGQKGSAAGSGHAEQVAHAVKNINEFFQMVKRRLELSMDEESGRMVVQIRDTETNEVVRQIPSKEVIRLAERLDEFKGLLFHDKV